MPSLHPQLELLGGTCLADKSILSRIVWGFVGLGVLARLIGYLLCPPLWVDECMLAEQFIDRGFLELLQPLDNNQVAPVGFLWIELAVVKLFGFSEWSLRLFPLVCGMASLFLFRHLASRLLTGLPFVLAVGCLAVAKAPTELSYDVKPYSCDLAVALALLILAVEWLRNPGNTGWLWGLAAAIPLALCLSFPAVFVAGALSLGLGLTVFRQRNRQTLGAFLTYHVALCGVFAAVMWINSGPQAASVKAFMEAYWLQAGGFPPLDSPVQLLRWVFDVHLSDKIFSIPYGSRNGGGAICFVCCVVGAITMYRQGDRRTLTFLLATFGLALLAAALRRYPYGGHIRLAQFLVPAICLLAGLGAAALLSRAKRLQARRLAWGLTAALVLFGIGNTVRTVARPWHCALDEHHREFARRFWQGDPHVVTICAQADLCENYSADGWDSYYRCNREIYSLPHHHGRQLTPELVYDLRQPIRLVVYRAPRSEFDVMALEHCLNQLECRFKPAGHECYQMPLKADGFDMYGGYEVFRFVPRQEFAQNVGQREPRVLREASAN
jgi:hypothetical protein